VLFFSDISAFFLVFHIFLSYSKRIASFVPELRLSFSHVWEENGDIPVFLLFSVEDELVQCCVL